jgi:hypothetical protein
MDNNGNTNNVLEEKRFSPISYRLKVLKLVLLLPALLFTIPYASGHTDSLVWVEKARVIATVNDFNITENEFEQYLHESRTVVISDFIRKYELTEISPGFWEKDFDGTKPKDVLKKVALQKAIYQKTRLVYMYEKGIIESPDYKFFLKKYSDFCENRNNSATSDIKYGPVQFSERDYFDYWYSNSIIELKNGFYYENDPAVPLADGKKIQSMLNVSLSNSDQSKNKAGNEAEIEKIFQERLQEYESNAEIKINDSFLNDYNPLF